MNLPHRQRGVALLVAILLVAIGTILAASIAFQSAMAARRGIASMSFEESVLVAQGAEAYAAYGLKQDSNGKDDYSEPWAQPFPPTEISPGVILEAHLEDLQGRFNLNSLVKDGVVDPQARNAFQRLLVALQIEPKWADQLADWLDADSQETGFDGLEDSGTTNQNPPYRVANTTLTSTSELLALPGFGRGNYMKLAPYVAALPSDAKLNVCTAAAIVLDAMMEEGHGEYSRDLETFANNRKKQCFPPLTQYKQQVKEGLAPNGAAEPGVQTWIDSHFAENSRYYRLTSIVTLGTSDFALYSLLQKGGTSGQQGKVRVVQRTFTPD